MSHTTTDPLALLALSHENEGIRAAWRRMCETRAELIVEIMLAREVDTEAAQRLADKLIDELKHD